MEVLFGCFRCTARGPTRQDTYSSSIGATFKFEASASGLEHNRQGTREPAAGDDNRHQDRQLHSQSPKTSGHHCLLQKALTQDSATLGCSSGANTVPLAAAESVPRPSRGDGTEATATTTIGEWPISRTIQQATTSCLGHMPSRILPHHDGQDRSIRLLRAEDARHSLAGASWPAFLLQAAPCRHQHQHGPPALALVVQGSTWSLRPVWCNGAGEQLLHESSPGTMRSGLCVAVRARQQQQQQQLASWLAREPALASGLQRMVSELLNGTCRQANAEFQVAPPGLTPESHAQPHACSASGPAPQWLAHVTAGVLPAAPHASSTRVLPGLVVEVRPCGPLACGSQQLDLDVVHERLMLRGVPAIVTLCELDGSVLHQNVGSLQHMGRLTAPGRLGGARAGQRASAAAAAAGSPGASAAGSPDTAPASPNLLTVLFSLDPLRLAELSDCMAQHQGGEGAVWQGIVQVPGPVAEKLPPDTATQAGTEPLWLPAGFTWAWPDAADSRHGHAEVGCDGADDGLRGTGQQPSRSPAHAAITGLTSFARDSLTGASAASVGALLQGGPGARPGPGSCRDARAHSLTPKDADVWGPLSAALGAGRPAGGASERSKRYMAEWEADSDGEGEDEDDVVGVLGSSAGFQKGRRSSAGRGKRPTPRFSRAKTIGLPLNSTAPHPCWPELLATDLNATADELTVGGRALSMSALATASASTPRVGRRAGAATSAMSTIMAARASLTHTTLHSSRAMDFMARNILPAMGSVGPTGAGPAPSLPSTTSGRARAHNTAMARSLEQGNLSARTLGQAQGTGDGTQAGQPPPSPVWALPMHASHSPAGGSPAPPSPTARTRAAAAANCVAAIQEGQLEGQQQPRHGQEGRPEASATSDDSSDLSSTSLLRQELCCAANPAAAITTCAWHSYPETQQPEHTEAPEQQPLVCWHEVRVSVLRDAALGRDVLLVVQTDVSERVLVERRMAAMLEAEHQLLEGIFPKHVLQAAVAAASQAGSRPQGPLPSQSHPQAPLQELMAGGLQTVLPQLRCAPQLATRHSAVTVLFADIVGFTPMCAEVAAEAVMAFLNDLFSRFDALLDVYGVYKVETIGDCYMVAGGLMRRDSAGTLEVRDNDDALHAVKVVSFAKAMLREAALMRLPTGQPVRMRVGVHSGPVTSGVVGTRMPRFCLFGDTVNTASRMESTCAPCCIHASATTRAMVEDEPWQCMRGMEVKGKGRMDTYLLLPETLAAMPHVKALAAATCASRPHASEVPLHTGTGPLHALSKGAAVCRSDSRLAVLKLGAGVGPQDIVHNV